MSDLAKIMPFVFGAAISPVLLVTTLYLLSLKNQPIKKTTLYLISATITITIISLIIFFTTGINPSTTPKRDLLSHIIIGSLLIILAIWIYKKGPSKPNKTTEKKQSNFKFLLIGVILMFTNFTTIAMILEVAIELRTNQIVGIEKSIYFLMTIFSSILPILLPLLILILAGKHANSILRSLSTFMSKYSSIVTSLFFLSLGLYTIVKPFI